MLKGFFLGVVITLLVTGVGFSSFDPQNARDKICKFVNFIFSKAKSISKNIKKQDNPFDEFRDKYFQNNK